MSIALDAMGGDHGPSVVVPAALKVLADFKDLHLILVGDREALESELRKHKAGVGPRLYIHHASQTVRMDDPPALALRNKKDSSMRVAINLVKQGEARACVSAGNTGALMATARYVLKTLPGVDRPAIITALPTMQGHVRVLDLGANVDCSADHLFQFAVMGSVLAAAVDNKQRPAVGLLNIGEETIKGNEQVKQAAALLSRSDAINYIGYVEGDALYMGGADVVACDGFVGNVALKSSEGVAKMISHFMRQEFMRSILTRLVGLLARPVLGAFRRRVDPRQYNGASLVGLQGIVIKSHGGADEVAFAQAIREAIVEVDHNIPERIGRELNSLLVERQAV